MPDPPQNIYVPGPSVTVLEYDHVTETMIGVEYNPQARE
jgi:hypothetical protein